MNVSRKGQQGKCLICICYGHRTITWSTMLRNRRWLQANAFEFTLYTSIVWFLNRLSDSRKTDRDKTAQQLRGGFMENVQCLCSLRRSYGVWLPWTGCTEMIIWQCSATSDIQVSSIYGCVCVHLYNCFVLLICLLICLNRNLTFTALRQMDSIMLTMENWVRWQL